MDINIPIDKKNMTLAILSIVNPIIGNLTSKELKLLSIMIDNNITIIDKEEREKVRRISNMDKYSFNNYIFSLKNKGVIKQTITDIRLNPSISNFKDITTLNINFQS